MVRTDEEWADIVQYLIDTSTDPVMRSVYQEEMIRLLVSNERKEGR